MRVRDASGRGQTRRARFYAHKPAASGPGITRNAGIMRRIPAFFNPPYPSDWSTVSPQARLHSPALRSGQTALRPCSPRPAPLHNGFMPQSTTPPDISLDRHRYRWVHWSTFHRSLDWCNSWLVEVVSPETVLSSVRNSSIQLPLVPSCHPFK